MAEEEEKKEEGLEDAIEQLNNPDAANSKKAKIKKILMIVVPIIVILVSCAVYFLVIKKPADGQQEKKDTHAVNPAEASKPGVVEDVYYDLDNFVINLNSQDSRPRFLKMTITLHVKSDVDVNIISKKIPIIRDNFQFYLRELKPADLQGSKEMMILKEELLLRINKILNPIVVQDILFKEILVN